MSDIKDSIIKQTSQAVNVQQYDDQPYREIMKAWSQSQDQEAGLRTLKKIAGAAAYMLEVQNLATGTSDKADTNYYPTGYSNFDKLFEGGLYPELYIMGAATSLGKTTFLLQMADQIAASGTDVLYFSMEMGATELVSKSISRMTYQLCDGMYYLAKTSRGITSARRYAKYTEREKNLIDAAFAEYAVKVASRLYIFEGVGDMGTKQIRELVEKHREITKKKAVVMIDYLQILAPHDPRLTDKRNTDEAVLELRRMSRDLNIPVMAISSFNRESYTNEVSFAAYKESGAIEYGSDVLIALQPQGMRRGYTKDDQKYNMELSEACRAAEVRKIELVVLKNRNGVTGSKIGFKYRPKFNLFDEDPTYKPLTRELKKAKKEVKEAFTEAPEDPPFPEYMLK